MRNFLQTEQSSHRYYDKSTARLIFAVVLSLLIHIALLLIQFGEYGIGLPGFGLPDESRRASTLPIVIQLENKPISNLGASGTTRVL